MHAHREGVTSPPGPWAPVLSVSQRAGPRLGLSGLTAVTLGDGARGKALQPRGPPDAVPRLHRLRLWAVSGGSARPWTPAVGRASTAAQSRRSAQAQQGPRGTGALTRAGPRGGHDPQDQPRGESVCPFPEGDTKSGAATCRSLASVPAALTAAGVEPGSGLGTLRGVNLGLARTGVVARPHRAFTGLRVSVCPRKRTSPHPRFTDLETLAQQLRQAQWPRRPRARCDRF